MNNTELIANTEIILEELHSSALEYLELLSESERETFVAQWQQLAVQDTTASSMEIIVRVNKLVYKYEALRRQFLGGLDIKQLSQAKFDPNAIPPDSDDSQNHPGPTVKIINEVVNAGKKLEAAIKQIRKK